MKVEDLMVGDFVAITEPDDFHGYTGKVVNINGATGYITVNIPGMHNTEVLVDDLQPIPLTEEILESNNFQSKEDPYSHRKFFFLGKNEYNLDVYFDNRTIILVEADYEPTIYAYMCDCEYVHKLQHLIRDLEIEKEIIIS